MPVGPAPIISTVSSSVISDMRVAQKPVARTSCNITDFSSIHKVYCIKSILFYAVYRIYLVNSIKI